MTYCLNLSKHDATKIPDTIFPRIVSAETIFFLIWPYVLWPLVTVHKSVETIQGRKLFSELRYIFLWIFAIFFDPSFWRKNSNKFHFLIFSWCAIHFGLSYPWAFDGPYKEIYLCWDCILLEMVARARWSYAHPGQIFGSKWTIGVH